MSKFASLKRSQQGVLNEVLSQVFPHEPTNQSQHGRDELCKNEARITSSAKLRSPGITILKMSP